MIDYYITPSSYDRAEKNGIKKGTLENRIRELAWSTEKATTTPTAQKKSYGKWSDLAVKNNITRHTFWNRVNIYGWDLERAATQPLMDKKKHIEKVNNDNRIYSLENIALAKANGICYSTLTNRLKHGWTMEEAVLRKTRPRKDTSLTGWRMGPKLFIRKGVRI